ncbi:DUF11 domain-containing protein [Thermoactinospora rubra]|uniref:DUF11 domain-containing protein n=1 Tax=Thermoactinospora rubra TaxID=1088767 RepID=UPI00117DC1C4|nr:DUF11 domain-containing protein [Thermoactinospora rubra]
MRVVPRPAIAQPGQRIVYRVRVTNAGPGDAVLPVLRVRMPAEVKVVYVDVADCRPGGSASEIVCASPTDVLAGGTGRVTIVGIVRPGARGPLRATANLTSEVVDGDEADNTDVVTTRVDEGADLGVRLRAAGRHALSAHVRNRGPRAVRDAVLSFTSGAARRLSVHGAHCRRRAGQLVCRLGAVRSGERVRLDVALRRGAVASALKAEVHSARLGDRHPADNVARLR